MRLSKLLTRPALIAMLALPSLLTSSVALAQLPEATVADAQRLLKQGQPNLALGKIDAYLASKPKDPRGRFAKGLILTELKRHGDAILVFKKLTEDFPDLPEPYNNLAVLYAQDAQYDKARQALEAAIRTHPTYAVAHENLGDIYAKLASQAYGKALQIDSANATAQTKMAMIRDLVPPVAIAPVKPIGEPIRLASSEAAASTTPAPPVMTVASSATPASPPAKAIPAPVTPAPPVLPTPATPTASVPTKANPSTPAPMSQSDASNALKNWAAAWSNKDVAGYLAAYAPEFETPGGKSRKTWENERATRIKKPGAISVDVEKINVISSDGNKATVTFRQNYKSANLNTTGMKTIVFSRHNHRWLIQQERVGQ